MRSSHSCGRSNHKESIVLTSAHVIERTKGDPQSKIYVRQMKPRGRVQQFEATVFHANYKVAVVVAVLRA